ncbi:ComF family protein, partial [Clostridium sp.]|uniref:ComF family protein n=1 Tax=Clostridium sp. TaxID=1506 RepID=UPI00346401BC
CIYYNDYAKDLILRLKSKKDFMAGEVLAKFMINTIKEQSIDFHYIVPVPIPKSKLKKRGFNQSLFLSKKIGEYFNKEVLDILYINKEVKEQKLLKEEDRLANLKDAFSISNFCKEKIKGKSILLVDDVITTGSTVYNCSIPLIEDSDNYVRVLTVAKSSI